MICLIAAIVAVEVVGARIALAVKRVNFAMLQMTNYTEKDAMKVTQEMLNAAIVDSVDR
ncbi:hypothetical protein R6242_21325 [Iodobacter sp. CM08]|uniref:hypothetical protein n=1 Tax=Iodobacter sp. CM08 TaxID=3085902 RepID=UPI002981BE76|nr:hypothetical protein [Iodobacter sp. CM08]MDW5419118.1 hypothetical protein [Iodobacter sp. CM08]